MEENCTTGSILNEQCNLLTYTRKTGSMKLHSLAYDDREKIIWRCGLKEHTFNTDDATICFHHELVYGEVFERRVSQKCCDIYRAHKNIVKGGHAITLEMAEMLERNGFRVLPGWNLCRGCFPRSKSFIENDYTEGSSESPVHSRLCSEDPEVEHPEFLRDVVNRNFHEAGVSPIKPHGATKSRQLLAARNKLERLRIFQEKQVAKTLDSEVESIRTKTTTELNQEVQKKAYEFDKLMVLIKGKVMSSNKHEKVKLLTLTPDSWSRKKVAEFFNVSEYLVRSARELKKKKGILAEPDQVRWKMLSDSTFTLVTRFFEDDEYSRVMPGKKDFVSIGSKQHMQKRLLLCNLNELHSAFKEKHADVKIGFSKSCSLRPKWCVLAGAAGTHSVFVCTYHQNAKLLVTAVDWEYSYKDLMKIVVCDINGRECMVHRCHNCSGKHALSQFLSTELISMENETIVFQQWQRTDRSTSLSYTSSIDEFAESLVENIDLLTSHSFIAQCQARYLKECKESLDTNTCIVLLDFAENFKYMVQDEVQSFHWNNMQCTLHPIVVYYLGTDGNVEHSPVCVLSDDNNHDTCFVHEVQRHTLQYIKLKFPNIKFVKYFSDGCAWQYKNYKNLLNLCFHNEDFDLDADWTFFATSHGKSPCDGIGGTVKRLITQASLQRPLYEQIITFRSLVDFCFSNIKNIHFSVIYSGDMESVRTAQELRFRMGKTIPGTRSYHYFRVTSNGKIRYKRTNFDPEFEGEFSFDHIGIPRVHVNDCKPGCFAACLYDGFWWIGLIPVVDEPHMEIKANFMHPHGPTNAYVWPRRKDICWVPISNILCLITTPSTDCGRWYTLIDSDINSICKLI